MLGFELSGNPHNHHVQENADDTPTTQPGGELQAVDVTLPGQCFIGHKCHHGRNKPYESARKVGDVLFPGLGLLAPRRSIAILQYRFRTAF